jgi:putative transport protein
MVVTSRERSWVVAAATALGLTLLLAVALGLALAAQTGAAQPPAAKPDSLVGGLLAGLGKQAFVLLFLVVAAGYGLGRLQIKGVGLGGTASTLLIALALSLVAAAAGVSFTIPEFAGTVFFNLYMFSVGMKVGPQFLSGLRREALHFILLALLVPLLSLGLIFLVRALFDPAPGMTPGIFAGAATATPGLGAAQTAITSGAARLPEGVDDTAAIANLSTAFAFAYCISTILFVVLLKVTPVLVGRDVRQAAREYEASIRGEGTAPLPGMGGDFFGGGLPPVEVRAYSLAGGNAVGRRLGEIREAFPLISIERILRRGKPLDPTDEVVLEQNDTLALFGEIQPLLAAGPRLGPEVATREARDVGFETVEVVLHRKEAVGRKLIDLARDVGHGLYLNAMFRGGEAIPFGPETVTAKGDVLRVTGSRWRIKILERESGKVVRPSVTTDVVTLALGLALGGLLGMITVPVGDIKLTLGAAVGLLLVGIGLSTLRTRYPTFGGPYPEPARQLLEDLGLNVFVAVLGLNSGVAVAKVVTSGALTPIVVGCLLVGFVPPVLAWFVGRRFMHMNLALLLGAVAGARCNSAGMKAAQEATASAVPAISYPVTFAVSNLLFTTLAYVMAMLG